MPVARFTAAEVTRALKGAHAVNPALTVRILPDSSMVIVPAADFMPEKPLDARAVISARLAALETEANDK